MKIKSFAMLAMSGLVAASFAYIAPAMADDSSNMGGTTDQSTQAAPSQSTPSDNNMQNQNNSGSSSDMNSGSSSSSSTGSDEASPDTATGDDDY